MTKKAHTVLFMLAATAVNMVLTLICFLVLMLLYSFFVIRYIPENAGFTGFLVILPSSFVCSFLIYRQILKLYLKKISH